VNSWLSLRFFHYSIYFDSLRNCYEAYAIWNFVRLLQLYLGDEDAAVEVLRRREPQPHLWPLCKMKPIVLGRKFLLTARVGTFQYVLSKLLTTFLSVVLEATGVWGEGSFVWNKGYGYVTTVDMISVTVAMYWLVMYYQVTKQWLVAFKPLPQFVCVKAVVFFCFWQGIMIALMKQQELLKEQENMDIEVVTRGLQDLLVCIEMLIAAMAHAWAFPHSVYENPDQELPPFKDRFKDMISINDVVKETVTLVNVLGNAEERKRLRDTGDIVIKLKKHEAVETSTMEVSPDTTCKAFAEQVSLRENIAEDLFFLTVERTGLMLGDSPESTLGTLGCATGTTIVLHFKAAVRIRLRHEDREFVVLGRPAGPVSELKETIAMERPEWEGKGLDIVLVVGGVTLVDADTLLDIHNAGARLWDEGEVTLMTLVGTDQVAVLYNRELFTIDVELPTTCPGLKRAIENARAIPFSHQDLVLVEYHPRPVKADRSQLGGVTAGLFVIKDTIEQTAKTVGKTALTIGTTAAKVGLQVGKGVVKTAKKIGRAHVSESGGIESGFAGSGPHEDEKSEDSWKERRPRVLEDNTDSINISKMDLVKLAT
jgi:hypothetical protein